MFTKVVFVCRYSFRAKSATAFAVSNLLIDIENGLYTVPVFTGLSNAFDTVK